MTQPNPDNARSTRRYKQLRADFRAQCERDNEPCWLDGQPIDYSLPKEHPDAFNLDHAQPVSTHPELADDPTNFRASHRACNERRGDDAPFIPIGEPSEDW